MDAEATEHSIHLARNGSSAIVIANTVRGTILTKPTAERVNTDRMIDGVLSPGVMSSQAEPGA